MISYLAHGITKTVEVTIAAFLIAISLGACIAVLRRSTVLALRWVGTTYVAILRGVPPIAWLLLIYYGPSSVSSLSPLQASSVALGLIGAAYMAEIYRAAVESVPSGLTDAADALGLSRADKYRVVILPNSLGLLLSATASYAIALLKDSSLASILAVSELTFRANQYRQVVGHPISVFVVVGTFYIVLSVLVAVLARQIESRTVRTGS
jgi:His/Glu/Gln/Arg/opine family amino acid ABC transporter permease subunit